LVQKNGKRPLAKTGAAFNYSNSSYCVNDTNPSPNITGVAVGTFSSTAGLSLTINSGAINMSGTAPGTYHINYITSSTTNFASKCFD
jgi:hypothetical protein